MNTHFKSSYFDKWIQIHVVYFLYYDPHINEAFLITNGNQHHFFFFFFFFFVVVFLFWLDIFDLTV